MVLYILLDIALSDPTFFSTNYGKSSGDFAVVMSAVRRWWNAVLPLINSPLERELLRPALETLISCITSTSKFARSEEPTVSAYCSRWGDKQKNVRPATISCCCCPAIVDESMVLQIAAPRLGWRTRVEKVVISTPHTWAPITAYKRSPLMVT